MTRAASIVSKDLRGKGVIESWENDVMRHSFCSYLLAKEQNISTHFVCSWCSTPIGDTLSRFEVSRVVS